MELLLTRSPLLCCCVLLFLCAALLCVCSAHPVLSDYSWRFPYPEHQQKEYFSPHSYVDEDSRRQSSRGGKSLDPPAPPPPEPWRSRERMRTQCVALVACLNLGVDPPDVVKPSPCARVECWVDPESMLPAKALKAIGGRLQMQYERWHEKARYKPLLDPTADELRKALIALRRVANDERLLLHYNGHGVPKPTANGEIWVYNKGSHDGPPTQYIPVSLYDLQTWMVRSAQQRRGRHVRGEP